MRGKTEGACLLRGPIFPKEVRTCKTANVERLVTVWV